jgi:DMSO/TMAO reductase YedYZ molybdopterin-dependent catalytic subunit
MENKGEVLASLPAHPKKTPEAGPYMLKVDGLVARLLELSLNDLAALPQQDLTDDFTCLEGWTVPKLQWRGVPLNTILAMAGTRPEARWVQASAGEFSVPIALEDSAKVLLATSLGAQPLPSRHGGPVRLITPGADCFNSIKWLDHLELRAEAAPNTGKQIALGRLRRSS